MRIVLHGQAKVIELGVARLLDRILAGPINLMTASDTSENVRIGAHAAPTETRSVPRSRALQAAWRRTTAPDRRCAAIVRRTPDDAPDRRPPELLERPRDDFVCRDHEIFDEFGRAVFLLPHDVDDVAAQQHRPGLIVSMFNAP